MDHRKEGRRVGYRDTWLNHAGAVSRHSEVVLHAFDREAPREPIRLLDVGVENGGSLEVWAACLPEGSTVLGMDNDERCGNLNLPVIICDVTDKTAVKEALQGRWFDLIVDSTGTSSPWTWAFLRSGGRLMLEDYEPAAMQELLAAITEDKPGWLPTEEIMRATVFPKIVVIEKRYPRVIPYIDIAVGNFADVTGEEELMRQGVKRVLVD
jgi:hypothetical protein